MGWLGAGVLGFCECVCMSEGVRWCGSDYALDIQTFTTAPAAGPFCQDFSLISLSGVRELKLGLRIRIRTCIKKMSPSGSGLTGCFFSHVARAGRHFTRNVLAPAIFEYVCYLQRRPQKSMEAHYRKKFRNFFGDRFNTALGSFRKIPAFRFNLFL